MSVSGLCEVCEQRTVEGGCDRCGRLVCAEHFDEETGLCVACAAELRRARDGEPAGRPSDMPDGVDTYRF